MSAVKPYRNYLAVSKVDPIAEHFIVWHEQQMTEVRVVRDSRGHPAFEYEGGMEGGVGPGTPTAPAMSADAAALAHALEGELREHCSWVPSWFIEYRGRYRRVTVQEFIALRSRDKTPGALTGLPGWFATYQVAMDESMRRVVGTISYTHGLSLGAIEVPRDAQWLAAPGNGMKLALVSDGPQSLASEIADAAQRLVRRAPGPTLASLVPPDAPLLPPGFVPRAVVNVGLVGVTRAPPSDTAQLTASIELHDAVFGTGASGDGEAVLAGERYHLHATLIPEVSRVPTRRASSGEFRGTLALHIEDDHGHAWEHAYPAHGPLDLEGESVVAPVGIGIPGASSPSPEADALQGQLPGLGPYRVVELRVGISTLVDPRL